jgi:hypothetical protein
MDRKGSLTCSQEPVTGPHAPSVQPMKNTVIWDVMPRCLITDNSTLDERVASILNGPRTAEAPKIDFVENTRRHIPDDSILHSSQYKNLKFHSNSNSPRV